MLEDLVDVAYNAFANAGEAPEEAGISADNDVYIGGDLEVDGTYTQLISPEYLPWTMLMTMMMPTPTIAATNILRFTYR